MDHCCQINIVVGSINIKVISLAISADGIGMNWSVYPFCHKPLGKAERDRERKREREKKTIISIEVVSSQ